MKQIIEVGTVEYNMLLGKVATTTAKECEDPGKLQSRVELVAVEMGLVLDYKELDDAYTRAVVIWCGTRIHKELIGHGDLSCKDYEDRVTYEVHKFCKPYFMRNGMLGRIREYVDWLEMNRSMIEVYGGKWTDECY